MDIISSNLVSLNSCLILPGRKSWCMLDLQTSSILRVNNGCWFIFGGKWNVNYTNSCKETCDFPRGKESVFEGRASRNASVRRNVLLWGGYKVHTRETKALLGVGAEASPVQASSWGVDWAGTGIRPLSWVALCMHNCLATSWVQLRKGWGKSCRH